MVAGSLTYDTKLNTNGFDKGLEKLNTKSVAVGNLLADAFKSIAGAMGQVIKQGINYNAQMENYEVGLTTLTGSAKKASAIMQQIREDAKATPFDVAGLTQGTQLLLSTGLNAERAREDILSLGNAISATGGGNEELSRMAVNLQQIKNVGKASALDIKQFAFAGIDIYGLLADSMGVTREEATKLDVTYEQLTGALKHASQEGGKYYKAMENQSKTFAGQMSNLKESFMVLFGEVAQPLFDFLKNTGIPVMNKIVANAPIIIGQIADMIPYLEAIGIIFASWKIGMTIQTIVQGFQKAKITLALFAMEANGVTLAQAALNGTLTIGETIVGLLTGKIKLAQLAVGLFTKAQTLMNAVLTANPIGIVVIAIGALIAILVVLWKKCDGFRELVINLWEKIKELTSKAVDFIKSAFNKIIDFFKNNWKQVLTLIINPFAGVFAFLYKLNPKFKKWVDGLISSLKKWFSRMWEVGSDIVKGIWNGISSSLGWIKSKIKGWVGNVVDFIKNLFGIHSPSTVMRDQVGKWLPKGIAVGIDANTDSALNSIDKMNDEIMTKMQQAVSQEQAAASFKGTSGSVTEILSANSVIKVENYNTLELDGEKVYENQQNISKNKNLQYGFNGGKAK